MKQLTVAEVVRILRLRAKDCEETALSGKTYENRLRADGRSSAYDNAADLVSRSLTAAVRTVRAKQKRGSWRRQHKSLSV